MAVTRTDWLDWYVVEGESAVFVEGRVVVLSELATELVDLVGDGASYAELADGLALRFGRPEGRDLVAETAQRVRELAEVGVLADGPGDRS